MKEQMATTSIASNIKPAEVGAHGVIGSSSAMTSTSLANLHHRVVPSMNDMQGDADDIGSRASDSPASSS